MQLLNKNDIVKAILLERDKIPKTLPPRPYEFGEQPNRDGDLIRGGIRKALHCIETASFVDAVPVEELIKLRDWFYESDGITMSNLRMLNELISKYTKNNVGKE